MARRGVLNPKVKLQPFLKNGTSPRCQFVKKELKGEKYGKQCEKSCTPGRPRCKYHGGKAGAPIKTGEHSKYQPVPKGLVKRFESASVDPEILNLTKDIALTDAQVWQLCEEASNQESFDLFQSKKLYALLKTKRELISQETDRRLAMGAMLSSEQALQIIKFIYGSINKHVADPEARRKVANDLRILALTEDKMEAMVTSA